MGRRETRSSPASYDEAPRGGSGRRASASPGCVHGDRTLTARRRAANLRHAHLQLPLRRLRHRVRAAGPLRYPGRLPRAARGAKLERLMSLTARPPAAREARRLQPSRPAAGWRLLRRRMSLAQPLSPRLARLRGPARRPPAGARRRRPGAASGPPWPSCWCRRPDAVLLIRRAERSGDPWSGHMALPGGRRDEDGPRSDRHRDPGDPRRRSGSSSRRPTSSAASTTSCPARRCFRRSPSGPTSSALPDAPALAAEPRGRRRPLGAARPSAASRAPTTRSSSTSAASAGKFPAYQLDDAIVWGMTERILTSLLGPPPSSAPGADARGLDPADEPLDIRAHLIPHLAILNQSFA